MKVTYFNPISNSRHLLIDNVDETTATLILSKFGDGGDEFHRLPEVRIEQDEE